MDETAKGSREENDDGIPLEEALKDLKSTDTKLISKLALIVVFVSILVPLAVLVHKGTNGKSEKKYCDLPLYEEFKESTHSDYDNCEMRPPSRSDMICHLIDYMFGGLCDKVGTVPLHAEGNELYELKKELRECRLEVKRLKKLLEEKMFKEIRKLKEMNE